MVLEEMGTDSVTIFSIEEGCPGDGTSDSTFRTEEEAAFHATLWGLDQQEEIQQGVELLAATAVCRAGARQGVKTVVNTP